MVLPLQYKHLKRYVMNHSQHGLRWNEDTLPARSCDDSQIFVRWFLWRGISRTVRARSASKDIRSEARAARPFAPFVRSVIDNSKLLQLNPKRYIGRGTNHYASVLNKERFKFFRCRSYR